jgi:serine/threonine-protein kinase RsbT
MTEQNRETIILPEWKELDELPILTESDIVKARQLVRLHAREIGLGIVDQTRITTAASELFRNMYQYANGGSVLIHQGNYEGRNAFILTCIDQGAGIKNLDLAMSDGYSSGQGMGYGLPGAKRLVDDFFIQSIQDQGTTIRIMKWI